MCASLIDLLWGDAAVSELRWEHDLESHFGKKRTKKKQKQNNSLGYLCEHSEILILTLTKSTTCNSTDLRKKYKLIKPKDKWCLRLIKINVTGNGVRAVTQKSPHPLLLFSFLIICVTAQKFSFSRRHMLIQLSVIHRVYYTPEMLEKKPVIFAALPKAQGLAQVYAWSSNLSN